MLGSNRVRCGICPQKEPFVAAGGRFTKRLLMRRALHNRQTVVMRTNPADQHVVAVDLQMVRGDGRRNMTGTIHDEIDTIRGRNVLQNDFKLGIVSQHRA